MFPEFLCSSNTVRQGDNMFNHGEGKNMPEKCKKMAILSYSARSLVYVSPSNTSLSGTSNLIFSYVFRRSI